MALSKNVLFSGITLGYHKITEIKEDYKLGKALIVMSSYVDKAARDANIHNHFQVEHFDVTTLELVRTTAYGLIKERLEWSDATDI